MKTSTLLGFVKKNEFIAIVLCITLVIVLSVASGVFWNVSNLNSLQSSIAPTAIMAFGMMLLLICGYFDLSIGSTMLLAGMVAGKLTQLEFPVPVIVLGALCSGLLVGMLNGFLVSHLKINPLIATIGVQFAGYGLAMTICDNSQHILFPDNFNAIGNTQFLGLYIMTWVMLILAVTLTYFLRYTPVGRRLFFIGGNREASKLIGFEDQKILFWAYVVTGLFAAIAGVLAAARIQSPSQYMGEGIHMTCIIACVVGGASFSGGKGSAVGAVFGVAFMSLLTNTFNLLEMKPQLQNIVVGLILVAVLCVDGYVNLKKMQKIGKI